MRPVFSGAFVGRPAPALLLLVVTWAGVPGLFQGQRHEPEARPGRAEEEVCEAPGRFLGT